MSKEQDAVHMVGHHDVCVYSNMWEMVRNACPTFACYFAKSTQYHFASPHDSKDVRDRADGNEICTRARIVITTQPERFPMHAHAGMPRLLHWVTMWSAARSGLTIFVGMRPFSTRICAGGTTRTMPGEKCRGAACCAPTLNPAPLPNPRPNRLRYALFLVGRSSRCGDTGAVRILSEISRSCRSMASITSACFV
jgi:hypothetical protein